MDFSIRNRNNHLGSTGAQNGFEFAKNMLLLTEGYETVYSEWADGWDGWYSFFTNGCEYTGGKNWHIYGCTEGKSQTNWLGHLMINVSGCASENLKYQRRQDKTTPRVNFDNGCFIPLTKDYAPEGYREWIYDVAVGYWKRPWSEHPEGRTILGPHD